MAVGAAVGKGVGVGVAPPETGGGVGVADAGVGVGEGKGVGVVNGVVDVELSAELEELAVSNPLPLQLMKKIELNPKAVTANNTRFLFMLSPCSSLAGHRSYRFISNLT